MGKPVMFYGSTVWLVQLNLESFQGSLKPTEATCMIYKSHIVLDGRSGSRKRAKTIYFNPVSWINEPFGLSINSSENFNCLAWCHECPRLVRLRSLPVTFISLQEIIVLHHRQVQNKMVKSLKYSFTWKLHSHVCTQNI